MPAQRGRIDTHQHIVPPAYADWLRERGRLAGGLPTPGWSVADAIDLMDANGIGAAILSVSTPGAHLGDDAEARLQARAVNEAAATVVRDRPDRFGFHATLTLPDVDGALAELAYACDVLHADGVVLHASAGGLYLGDAAWEPLMQELERRRAVVFVHPGELGGPEVPGIGAYVADFLLDTTRAAISYAKAGCLERYPSVKVILSHGGGFVPYAAQRIARACSSDGDTDAGIARLRQFYFDTALASSPYGMPSLLAFADPARITYGSDWPYAPKARAGMFTRSLDAYPLDAPQRAAIDRGNAELLFPRLRE